MAVIVKNQFSGKRTQALLIADIVAVRIAFRS
jgi:hypothetical protein